MAPVAAGRVGPWYDANRGPRRYGLDMNALRPPLLRRLRPGHWVAIDCAVTAAMAVVYAAAFRDPPYLPGMPEWATAATVLAVLPAALRRRWPRAVLALVVTGGAILTALSTAV